MRGARALVATAGAFLLVALSPGALAKEEVRATDDEGFRTRFEPAELTTAPGEEVVVTNTGRDRHTFTASEGAPWAEVDVEPGRSGTTRAPAQPGDYRFYCRYHASPAATTGMVGVLHVQAGPAPEDGKGAPLPGGLPFAAVAAAALLALRGTRAG